MHLKLFAESSFNSMENATSLGFLMTPCDKQFIAIQFAIFTVVGATARILAGPTIGYIVANLGWASVYLIDFFIALPGVALIGIISRRNAFYNHPNQPRK